MIGRLRLRRDFERLRRAGRSARSGPLLVVAMMDHEVGEARVAFAVPRKVGGAVVRNRLRRRLRAHLPACGPAPGLYLIRVFPGAETSSGPELRSHLERAVERATRAAA
ncbi:MAG: ribonuclease P protein component [Actinomycetota bacterium]